MSSQSQLGLPVVPPVRPMLAKSVAQIPAQDAVPGGLLYEPKWDGFRCIVFRDAEQVVMTSRSGKDLARYFPELVDAFRRELPDQIVLDGEILLAKDGRLEFDLLSQRIHPAKSRIEALASDTPAFYVAFDLLALGQHDCTELALQERRSSLVTALASSRPPVHLTQITTDQAEATRWFSVFEGAGLDGVVAKALDEPYVPNSRRMLKIKHVRTADVVVAGYRLHKDSTETAPLVGSLLLGLFAASGELQHVGVAASFSRPRRGQLFDELSGHSIAFSQHPWGDWLSADAQAGGRLPGGQSRWTGTKDLSWFPIAPSQVAEVGYEHMEGDRFRHTAQFKRWRPDRDPQSCTYEQLEEVASYDLAEVLDGLRGEV